MDLIIRLIISIFEEIFSQDAKRRREARARRRSAEHQLGSRSAGRAPVGPALTKESGEKKPTLLDELFKQLEGLEAAPPQPPAAKKARPPRPKPEPRTETYEEHLARIERRAEEIDRETESHLGLKHQAKKRAKARRFDLPGKTDLEQLIYAQVILGPSKANRARRVFF